MIDSKLILIYFALFFGAGDKPVADSKGKSKVHLRTGHESPERNKYRYTLSLTSALDGWVVNATPRPFYPRNDP